jgi:predicted RNA-binding protein with PIN domain
MKIDNDEIPEEAFRPLADLLDGVSDDDLLAFAKGHGELLMGIRPIKANADKMRSSLKRAVAGGRLDASVREFLAGHSLQMEFVAVLSEVAIEWAFPQLATYFGDARFAAATLLDPRPHVRRLALDHIRGQSAWASPADEAARLQSAQELEELFAPFLGHVADLRAKAPPLLTQPAPDLSGEVRRLEEALRQAGDKLGRQEQRAAREKREQEDKAELLRGAARKLEQAVSKETARAAAADRSLKNSKTDQARVVGEAVQAELSALVRPWLQPVLALDAAGRAPATQSDRNRDLAGRVRAALTLQAQHDPHYRNLAGLEPRLAPLESLRAELSRARSAALHPLPQLEELAFELDGEIRKVRSGLASPEEAAEGLAELHARINRADVADLGPLHDLLDAAAGLRALRGCDLESLYAALDRQASQVYERYPLQDLSQTPLAPLRALKLALAHDHEHLLLVDGYNVLHEHFHPFQEDDKPGRKERDELTNALVRIFGSRQKCRARLYFDGPVRESFQASDQVRVVYSGLTGDNRADRAILEDLQAGHREAAATPRCVVSDDQGLAREVLALKAGTMQTLEFAVLLRSAPSPGG